MQAKAVLEIGHKASCKEDCSPGGPVQSLAIQNGQISSEPGSHAKMMSQANQGSMAVAEWRV